MKLVYFNARGLAETSRFLLALANKNYEDYRYPIQILDWESHNSIKDEFDSDKNEGKLIYSLNKLPYLQVENRIIPQSKAIERYIAKRFNMMGTNDLEAAMIDSICEYVRDIKDAYQKVKKTNNIERLQAINIWFLETLPNKLESLEIIMDNTNHAVGNYLSLADVVLYSLIIQFFDDVARAYEATGNTIKIRGIVNKLQENKYIQNWINIRPKTPF